MKIMNLKNHTANPFVEEKILKIIDFAFIVKLYYSFCTHNKMYLILDFIQGGFFFLFLIYI